MRKLLLIVLLSLGIVACSAEIEPTPLPTATNTPTLKPATATPKPTATKLPTITPTVPPPATFTLVPTETPTQTPTPSVTPTPSRTPTITPTSVIDRACPEFYFPIYNRNWLAADKWPSPNPNPETHLWFTRPLAPIGDRFLINTNFPYGFDGGVQGALLLHNGVDVSQDYGTPLLAVADGVVVYAGADLEARYGWRCDWYGKFVVILHDDEWLGEPVYSLYGHVQNIIVEPGQRVFRAEQVAEVGSGGAAKVNHLHFEIRVGENDFFNSRNPLLWIAPASGRGVLAGRIVDPRGRPWQGISLILEPNDPNLKRYQTWSYLGDPDNVAIPDEHLAENFVIGDMKAGSYTLHTIVQGANYRQDIFIEPGQINTVEIVTGPFRTPTPSPP